MADLGPDDIRNLTSALTKLVNKLGKSDTRQKSTTSTRVSAEEAEAASVMSARELIKSQEEINKLVKEYTNKLDNTRGIQQAIYQIDDSILAIAKQITAEEKKGNQADKKKVDALKATVKSFKAQKQELEETQEQAAMVEKKLKGVYDTLESMKNPLKKINETFKTAITKSFLSRLKETGVGTDKISTVLKRFAPAIGLAAVSLGAMFKTAMRINQEIVEMRRNFGLSEESALHLRHSIQDAAISSQILGATQADYNKAFLELVDEYGIINAQNAKLLDTQVLLTKQIGMTSESANSFRTIAESSGKTVEESLLQIKDTVIQYNQLTGDSISHRDVQREISKIGKNILANYKGNVKQLAAAVIQAKRLGISMEQASSVADKLLDIEGSITAEMTANVLTGKQMNLNRARELALQGDTVAATAEAIKQAGSYNDLIHMSYLGRKAVAEAAGVELDTLMSAAMTEKKNTLLKKRNFRDLSDIEKQRLIDQKQFTKEEIAQGIRDEQAVSVKEKMAQISDKLLTIFEKLSGPILKVVTLFEKALTYVDKISTSVKNMIPPELAEPLKKAGAIAGGTAAIAGGLMLFKGVAGFFAKAISKGAMPVTVEGGGVSGSAAETEESSSSMFSGLGKSAGRLMKAGKKGGLKGLGKAASRMAKSGLKGLTKGGLKGLGGKLPYIGSLLTTGMNIANEGFNWKSLARSGIEIGGGTLGGLLGSLALPGAGTLAGGVAGTAGGSWLADQILGPVAEVSAQAEEQDFISRPGQPPISFSKGDLIAGIDANSLNQNSNSTTTNTSKLEALLEKLIAKVDQPMQVVIGNRVIDEIDTRTGLRRGYTTKVDSGYGVFG
jgi:hypothetical protein